MPYIDRITVAQKIRAKYFNRRDYKPFNIHGKELGSRRTKGLANNIYSFDEDGYLIDIITKEKVIANPKKAGNVREWVINFQKIYDGTIRKHIRNNYLNLLKELITPWITIEPITEYPIKLEFFIFATEMPVDVSNKGVCYTKVFEDILQKLKVIPNDSSNYIRSTGATTWIPVGHKSKEKMIFVITKIENENYDYLLNN